ncbi:paraquat-inducible A domain protein, partial [Vibrio parahaemolyticus VPTS-2010_2]
MPCNLIVCVYAKVANSLSILSIYLTVKMHIAHAVARNYIAEAALAFLVI